MAIFLGKKSNVQDEQASVPAGIPVFPGVPIESLAAAARREDNRNSILDHQPADCEASFLPEALRIDTQAAVYAMPSTAYGAPPIAHDVQAIVPNTAVAEQTAELQKYAGEPLESILIALGAKREYVREALKRKSETHESLPVIVRDMGLVSQEMVAKAIAYHTGYEYFSLADADAMDLADVKKLQEIIDNISKFHYSGFILVGFNNKGGVQIAVDTQERVNEARNLFFDYQPSIVIASGQTILKIYRKHFANTEWAFKAAVAAYHLASQRGTLTDEPGLVFRVIGSLLRHACYAGASDVFIWATRKVGQIGLKIDGKGSIFTVLKNETFDSTMELLISSCGLTETIKQGPQETKVEFAGSPPDIRAEFDDIFGRFHFRMEAVMSPTGKKNVVIRINDGQSTETDFTSLPFDSPSREIILKNVHAPTGLVLITGPTGSGKTTTMYSILREINPIQRRVFTVENPIEYHNGMWIQHELPRPKMDGNKRQTEGDVGREYLKALLREAPDVILWGEVRDDQELVKTLLAAANTGHLVFTSLHTNSAPKAVLRLMELGANRDALASVLRLVIAQRLVAKLCQYCKVPDTRAETIRTFKEHHIHQFNPCVAVGCPHCGDFGYRGRQMIYEIMPANNVRQLIEEGASISKIEQEGVPKTDTIWYRGLNLVADGVTSMDELMIRADRG
ncbi:MAG: GspE/PulE family protein [Sulfuriferula sp.]